MLESVVSLVVDTAVRGATNNDDLSFLDISFLTFEAVLEVVIICFAGFVVAKTGLLNANGQKVLSQLNVDLFTPCLVFAKLAPALSFLKMADIFVIPVFYAVSTAIAYGCSQAVASFMRLNEPESDFVTAMAVFGNSNSLPVSLTMSLAYTLPDLLWEDIDNDSSDKVASRGILYLLIFQQLGQILRWSWGFNKLLRKRSHAELHSYEYSLHTQYDDEATSLLEDSAASPYTSPHDVALPPPTDIATLPNSSSSSLEGDAYKPFVMTPASGWNRFVHLPVVQGVLRFMNPPLYAMAISVVVASVPAIQNLFFNTATTGGASFVHNTITRSITQLGSVSIPLILIVLGSNLYPSRDMPKRSRHYARIVIGSLLLRMILPSFILLPAIALTVKFVKLSILDDPIFLIVSFVLTISPPAIQLSQITQINNIYQQEMAGVLFWGYVVMTLPTTIFIVVTSLEVLKWAT